MARYPKTQRAQDGSKNSDNKGKKITEVKNRKQMGRRDPETMKSP